MDDLRLTVKNVSPTGGLALTPFWFGLHDGSFNLFEVGGKSSAGLEAIAEDGNLAPIASELTAADSDAIGGAIIGTRGPIGAGETTSQIVTGVNGATHGSLSFAAMLLPSNDAFIGTENSLQLFDSSGTFLGERTINFSGLDVYDAGTEVNTERDAAFINQTAPNTGITENGVIMHHPGFNGSLGNPVGEGDQIILGGTNAFGELINPVAADFTQPGSQVAVFHINTTVTHTGSARRDVIRGKGDDDIVNSGAGNDHVSGGKGWDVINAGEGDDWISGGAGDDAIMGGAGRDDIQGGQGDDMIGGGSGNNSLSGGRGNDVFVFSKGSGRDTISDFDNRSDDRIIIDIAGFDSFEDVMSAASSGHHRTVINFGDGDSLVLNNIRLHALAADDFLFV